MKNIKNQNIFFFKYCAVEAAKRNCLSSGHVEIHLQRILLKMLLGKTSFMHVLFLENKALMNQNKHGMIIFMSRQVGLPKIRLILQKWKSAQKVICAVFAQSLQNYCVSVTWWKHTSSMNCWSNDGRSNVNLHFDDQSCSLLFFVAVFSKRGRKHVFWLCFY